MTTICWDGRELVSDSQITRGDTIGLAPFRKIHQPEPNEYWEINGVKVLAFAMAGNANAIDYAKEKLGQGITFKTRFEENEMLFTAIILDELGQSYLWNVTKVKERNRDHNSLLPMLPPIAVGSGAEFALGVMAIGKGARLGLKAAIRLDVNTGGPVQIFEFPGKPEVLSVRPPKAEEPKPAEPAPAPAEPDTDAKRDIEHAPTPNEVVIGEKLRGRGEGLDEPDDNWDPEN